MPCTCLPDERQPASFISTRLDLDRAITAHPHVSGPSALEPRGRGIAPRSSFNHSQILHRAGCLRSHSERLSLVGPWMAVRGCPYITYYGIGGRGLPDLLQYHIEVVSPIYYNFIQGGSIAILQCLKANGR